MMHAVCMVVIVSCVPGTLRSIAEQDFEPPDRECLRPALSADGRFVAFDAMATNLVPGDSTPFFDVFLFDTQTQDMSLLSATPSGQAGDGPSLHPSISADGSSIVFASHAADLVQPSGSGTSELYLFSRTEQRLRRLPVAGPDQTPDGDCRAPRISADGRYVVFESLASNLVDDDTNAAFDVFVHDLADGTTQRVSVASGGGQCVVGGLDGSISADGRYVCFSSQSDDAAPEDANSTQDVLLHDRRTGETRLVSRTESGASASGWSGTPLISADGSTVVFASLAKDLTTDRLADGQHIFVADVASGRVRCATVAETSDGEYVYHNSPSISADGGVIAFASTSERFSQTALNSCVAIFSSRRPDWRPFLVSKDASDAAGEGESGYPVVSPDGQAIAFATRSSNIAASKLKSATIVLIRPDANQIVLVAPPGPGQTQPSP